jgi:dTMP kinase
MFIVLEGCDAVGKTSQATKLAEALGAELLRFPDRTTLIGAQLNAFLQGELSLELHASHLLFAANRWELQKKIAAMLDSGKTVVCDRYSGSGVAYSVASGLSQEWCLAMERNLLVADLVVLLDNPNLQELQARRPSGLRECFDSLAFQTKVRQAYLHLAARFGWHVVSTTSLQGTFNCILEIVQLAQQSTCKSKRLDLRPKLLDVPHQEEPRNQQEQQEEPRSQQEEPRRQQEPRSQQQEEEPRSQQEQQEEEEEEEEEPRSQQVQQEEEEEEEEEPRSQQVQQEDQQEEERDMMWCTTRVEWRVTPSGYDVSVGPRTPYGARI